MIVSAIVATSSNLVIGRDNEIPWHLPADLRYFKKTTLGHFVIMGRNTFLSIGRPLPKRTNIVVSRNIFFTASGCLIAHSIEEALTLANDYGEEEVFIIGGSQVYKHSLPYLDRLYLTKVDVHIEPGEDSVVYFPELNWEEWSESENAFHEADEKNPYAYTFLVYDRIENQNTLVNGL